MRRVKGRLRGVDLGRCASTAGSDEETGVDWGDKSDGDETGGAMILESSQNEIVGGASCR